MNSPQLPFGGEFERRWNDDITRMKDEAVRRSKRARVLYLVVATVNLFVAIYCAALGIWSNAGLGAFVALIGLWCAYDSTERLKFMQEHFDRMKH
jgi:hypothetical protein